MSDILLNLLFAGLIFWSCFLLCDLSLKRTIPGVYIYLIMIGVFIIESILYYDTSFSQLPYAWYLFALLPILILPLFYRKQITMIIFTFMSSLLFCFMIQTAVKLSEYIIYLNYPEIYATIDSTLIFMISLSIYFICIPAFLRIGFEKIAKLATSKALWLAWLFPIAGMLILLFNDYHDIIYTSITIRYMETLLILIIIAYLVFYMMLTSSNRTMIQEDTSQMRLHPPKETRQTIANKDLMIFEKQYFESIINSYNDALDRSYLVEQGLHTIQRLLINHNFDDALRCLSQLRNDTSDIKLLEITGNTVIDSLLSYYHYLFRRDELKLNFNIQLPPNSLRDLDLCILFGGLLQNAYDLLYDCQMEKGEALLACEKEGNKITITCSNTYLGDKENIRKAMDELNLKSVRELSASYHGGLEIECPKDVVFVDVALNL